MTDYIAVMLKVLLFVVVAVDHENDIHRKLDLDIERVIVKPGYNRFMFRTDDPACPSDRSDVSRKNVGRVQQIFDKSSRKTEFLRLRHHESLLLFLGKLGITLLSTCIKQISENFSHIRIEVMFQVTPERLPVARSGSESRDATAEIDSHFATFRPHESLIVTKNYLVKAVSYRPLVKDLRSLEFFFVVKRIVYRKTPRNAASLAFFVYLAVAHRDPHRILHETDVAETHDRLSLVSFLSFIGFNKSRVFNCVKAEK